MDVAALEEAFRLCVYPQRPGPPPPSLEGPTPLRVLHVLHRHTVHRGEGVERHIWREGGTEGGRGGGRAGRREGEMVDGEREDGRKGVREKMGGGR